MASGTLITSKSADFSKNPLGYVPAVPDGLEYVGFYGGGGARTSRNFARGKAPGVLYGSPVYSPASVTLTPKSNYIATSVPQSESMTVLLVIAPITETPRSIIFGNADLAPASNGSFIMLPAVGAIDGFADLRFTVAQRSDSGQSVNINVDLPNSMRIGELCAVVARMDEVTRERLLMVPKTGERAVNVGSYPVDIGTTPMLIGSYYHNATFTAPVEFAAAAIYSRALSDGEIETLYRSVAGYYASLGISV